MTTNTCTSVLIIDSCIIHHYGHSNGRLDLVSVGCCYMASAVLAASAIAQLCTYTRNVCACWPSAASIFGYSADNRLSYVQAKQMFLWGSVSKPVGKCKNCPESNLGMDDYPYFGCSFSGNDAADARLSKPAKRLNVLSLKKNSKGEWSHEWIYPIWRSLSCSIWRSIQPTT